MKAIVVIPTQGFANRLRMIASSYILAQYMKLDHYIIWKPYTDCNIDFDDIFEKHPFQLINEEIISKSKYVYFGNNIHSQNIMDKILNPGNVNYIVLSGGHEFKHPAMNCDEFLKAKYKLYNKIKFKTNDLSFLPDKYACIHIRTVKTEDKKDIEANKCCDFPNNSPIEEFLALTKKIEDDFPIYIISNDIQVVNTFIHHFPNKQIYTSYTRVFNRDKNGIQSALNDFVILSKAEFIIGSYYSSFSDEACFVNLTPKVIPLNKHLYNEHIYHCFNFVIKNQIGYLNYNTSTLLKYLY